MSRGLGMVGAAFVMALALAPRGADAQQIFACVNNSSGTIHIVGQNVACQNNEVSLKWSSGLGGVPAASSFFCRQQQIVSQPLSFTSSFHFAQGVSFGSGISTLGSTFDTILLQQGIYQIHLSGSRFGTDAAFGPRFPTIYGVVNGVFVPEWSTTVSANSAGIDATRFDIVGGDRLISVGPNTTFQLFIDMFGPSEISADSCSLIITKLQ